MRKTIIGAVAAALLSLHVATAAAADELRWDVRDLYPTAESWNTAQRDLAARIAGLERHRATLGGSAKSLLQALTAISDAQRAAARLYVYASLQSDEDLREPRAQERLQQAQATYTQLSEKTAWLAPAVQALGAERVRRYGASEPELKRRFDFYLNDTLRNKPHTLAPASEALLAAAGQVLAQPTQVYQQLAETELPRQTVQLVDGSSVLLTTSAYEQHRRTSVRADRKRIFDGFFGAWKKAEGTFGANLNAQLLGDVYMARARRFAGSLDAALFADNMPPAVYRMLVEQANAGLPTLHRYLRLRAKMLAIEGPLAYYDNYPPLVTGRSAEVFDIARSRELTLQALAPLGPEYAKLLERGFAANWIDSHPRTGKASGGYMAGSAYDVHPYVLLNHNDDYESLSTWAHEWGHAVHSLLANASQPFDKAGYSTFIAESASIANEMLLGDFMVANAKTREDKLYYLATGMESIRTTFFRQVMFAEFQLATHEEVEKGRPLSGARLTEMYCALVKRYYGEAEGVMTIDPTYCIEWAYVPHFYRPYYVWQYASSIVGAAQLTEAIQRQGAPARERFVNLLKAGSSDYAYPLVVKAGVDLAQAAPYKALIARMNRLMDEFERLAATPPLR